MQKHAFALLFSPMFLIGMQDPSNFHHDCEAPMWKQAAKLAKDRTYSNAKYIAGGIISIATGTYKANAAIAATNAAAHQAALTAAFTSPIMVDLVGTAAAEAAATEMGLLSIEGYVVGAHAIDSLATVIASLIKPRTFHSTLE